MAQEPPVRSLDRSAIAAVFAVLLGAGPAIAQTRQFNAGSLIIPTDNCYQGDVAQITVPKELDSAAAGGSGASDLDSSACAGGAASNSVMANGARRAYGLVWLLLKAGVPVYWIVNPDKNNANYGVDSTDLTIGTCGNTQDAVMLVDPSLPASYCGLDSLHPTNPPPAVTNTPGFPSQCQGGTVGHPNPTGVIPLSNNGHVGSVNYRGGPFIIDAKDAAVARDVMAWYFAAPPGAINGAGTSLPNANGVYWESGPTALGAGSNITGPLAPNLVRPYTNPWAANSLYLDGSPTSTLPSYGAQQQYFDPGHHPLHWSDYTPSVLVPFYPAEAFSLDIGAHSIIWPCEDSCMCPYTTWDPLNPNGYVDPWAGTLGANGFNTPFQGPASQNAITYATVNVHQAQVSFMAPVAKVFDSPMSPIALVALTDPVHLNTFRFYMEEAGLTFGPCDGPPGTWFQPGTGLTPNPNGGGAPAGLNDYFFDPDHYPFPTTGGVNNTTPSTVHATCAEGLSTTDPGLLASIDGTPYGGSAPNPPPTGGPYGQVIDVIAPEPAAIQSLLGTDNNGNPGCGAPAYQETWVPHWDAFLCSGPSTRGCPLAAQVTTCSGGVGDGCPGSPITGWGTLSQAAWPANPVTPGSKNWAPGPACSTMTTGTDGYDPYCPQLVQTTLNALQTYVWKGGNLLAECIGAASMEDVTMRFLLGQFGVNQQITHFMSEWDNDSDGISAYYPNQYFYPTATANHNGGQMPPGIGNTNGCINIAANTCDGEGDPTNLCNTASDPTDGPYGGQTSNILAVGWAGPQVSPIGGPGNTISPNNDAVTLQSPTQAGLGFYDTTGRFTVQFNGGGGQNPGDPPIWNAATTYALNTLVRPTSANGFYYQVVGVSGTASGGSEPNWPVTIGATVVQNPGANAVTWKCASMSLHLVWYAPPSSLSGGSGSFPNASLTDPLLQIGDFYYEGIYGATETWSQGVRGNEGYAASMQNPDTYPLIRNLPATSVGWNTAMTGTGGPYYGDDWVYNHNTANNGEAGQVVYLGGDSYDGRPDGLRLIWSSMLNLGFLPSSNELARSSGAAYQPTATTPYHSGTPTTPGEYLLQGTFIQQTLPAKATTNFTHNTVAANWAYPETLGHFRQYDIQAGNSCLNSNGTLNSGNANCGSAVTGQGSNTTNYVGPGVTAGNWNFWDSSGADPANTNWALLTNSDIGSAPNHRVLFTQLYEALSGGNAGVGLKPVWLNPANAGYETNRLACAIFPNAAGCPGNPATNVACPDGIHCIEGPLACATCVSGQGPPAAVPISSTDVQNLLGAVDDSTGGGGCTPLLKDSCYGAGTPQLACLDKCWSQCYQTCNAQTQVPPFGCQTPGFNIGNCAHDCSTSCNGNHGQGVGGADCGVGQANSAANFRQLCYPSLGGIDHSTPVIVGPPPASIAESYPAIPTSPGSTPINAQCRPTVAYVGAADGFLHAIYIDEGSGCDPGACAGQYVPGQEIWAFMPNQQLSVLPTNGNCAQSLFVDGVPVVKDVLADVGDGRGPQWHTILTETEGAGGNHVFALDVTDPMAPVRGICDPSKVRQNTLQGLRMILWENGDPLDTNELRPNLSSTANGPTTVPYLYPGETGPYRDDLAHEGPGFPTNGLVPPAPSTAPGGTFNHYLGPSASVFMGQLLGSGSVENVTYVAAQNDQTDGYGRAIVQPPACSGGCNPKDFTNPNAGIFGPAGEVVYAFDSVTGVPRTQQASAGGAGIGYLEHFTERYFTKGPTIYRSNGNNDIPAPTLGVTLSGRPGTELLVVPDLDGQVWGLFPGTLASYRTLSYGGNATAPFPLFDIQRYRKGGQDFSSCAGGNYATALAATAQGGTLTFSAPFANPAAFLPPGTCQGFEDPVVLLASGGVDWGPPASIMVALDVAASNNNLASCTASNLSNCQAGQNDSAAAPMPVADNSHCTPLEVATCEGGLSPTNSQCQGRVFGQPIVLGQDVLFTTSTGTLTGVGADLPQQQGSGNIEALGSASCTAANTNGCGVCISSEQTADLATNVGKVGSGLAAATTATNPGTSTTTYQVFSSSTTGLGTVSITANNSATPLYQKLLLEEWWLRQQARTP